MSETFERMGYEPHQYQQAFHENESHLRVVVGEVGCGKAHAAAAEIARIAIDSPGSRIAIVSTDAVVFREGAAKAAGRVFGHLRALGMTLDTDLNISLKARAFTLPNGSVIEWGGAVNGQWDSKTLSSFWLLWGSSEATNRQVTDILQARMRQQPYKGIITVDHEDSKAWLMDAVEEGWFGKSAAWFALDGGGEK